MSELGWRKTGAGGAVVVAAMERCSFHHLLCADIYRKASQAGQQVEGKTWVKRSLTLLRKWVCNTGRIGLVVVGTKDGYKAYVDHLADEQCSLIKDHRTDCQFCVRQCVRALEQI